MNQEMIVNPMNRVKRVLLVEDEMSVVTFIKRGLEEEGFDVSVAFNGLTGQQMAQEFDYDLLILDIMIPEKNGLDVCTELRAHGLKTPILFLTALSTSENIVIGLNSGADDYLVKPFKFMELHARINALIRRHEQVNDLPVAENRYYLADLTVDDDAKTVARGGNLISLTATEYRLLLVLIKNKGKVLSRVDLLEGAWDINFNLGTNVVDVYINYLRKKLDTDYSKRLIHTVVGMGYVLKEA